MDFVEAVYRLTEGFPPEEKYGLTSQLRRATVSVPSNIAEGASGGSDQDFVRFLRIARASLAEVDTQLELAVRLGYVSEAPTRDIETLSAMMASLIRSLSAKHSPDKSVRSTWAKPSD